MARVDVTVVAGAKTGQVMTLVAADATNHHKYKNTGKERLLIDNSAAAVSCVATVQIPSTTLFDGAAVVSQQFPAVTVLAGERRLLAPLDPTIYNQTDGYVYFNTSTETNVDFIVV